ncbi:DUF6148 family protein [Paenibacillus sp. UNC451MF]|uniref:DUF6148 family protein n=1 Tax=Paenibacillus sp. UNC451MF TaxID=1449063 RepID=UPI00048DA35B|nr:DUF6148 family protein [Paenibacillus sp. UNC451MF]
MAWTLEDAKKHLDAWLAAELAVSTGQSYRIGTRQLERASLSEIRQQITFWRNEVSKLAANRRGSRVMRVVPRDL